MVCSFSVFCNKGAFAQALQKSPCLANPVDRNVNLAELVDNAVAQGSIVRGSSQLQEMNPLIQPIWLTVSRLGSNIVLFGAAS